MEQLPNGITLDTGSGAFPLSTDSMVLAGFARLPKNARVLDLGSGCGTLGLLLCAKDPGCQVTGIELSEDAHRVALENIRRNALEGRLSSICGNVAQIQQFAAPGSFSVCISNPPYFSGGPASKTQEVARSAASCPPEVLFRSAARSLKTGGDFYLVHRPEALAQLCSCGSDVGLQAKRLLLLRHRPDSRIALIFLAFRKGGKPGLQIEEASLYDAAGSKTPFYKRIYHINDEQEG